MDFGRDLRNLVIEDAYQGLFKGVTLSQDLARGAPLVD